MKVALLALYDVYSFGIRGLNSLLKQHGHDVTSLFFKNSTYTDGYYTQSELNVLISTIKDLKPDLLGIAVRSPLFPLFKEISIAIRPDIPILVGGHHATADPKSCIVYADHVCVGEGENVILELLNDIRVDIKHQIFWRKKINGIWPNKPIAQVEDLNSIPFDYYGDDDIYLYSDPKFNTQTERNLWTSRGCPFNCTYCFGNVTRKLYGSSCVRRKSVSRVIENVRELQRTFPALQEIIFTDHVFTFNIAWIREFCEAFPGTGLKFRCFGHFSLATPEMLAMLKSAGMTHISFGIESGSKRIRKLFNRNTPEEQIIETSRVLSELGIMGRFDIIVNNPFDTSETLKETRELIKKLTLPFIVRNFEMRFFPGTDLTAKALSDGLIEPDDVEGQLWCKFGNWHFNYECG